MALTAHQKAQNPFKPQKAIQAVAFLLKQKTTTKSDNYMRVLKLLYFADRESLKETGCSITGDRFVAMPHGPTLSNLLDLVNQRAFGCVEWDKYLEKDGYDIRLINDPGNSKLCRYEIDLLKRIWDENINLGEWGVAIKSEQLPEWIKNNPGQSSRSIPLADVLEAIGRADWLEDIQENAAEDASAKHLFGADC